MATKTPVGRSIRRTHLCGAGPQAPSLHFRAPFKPEAGQPSVRQGHLDVWVPARPNRLETSRLCPAEPGRSRSGLVILGVRKRSSTPKSPPGGAVSLARIPL
ncbi:unnamed protein product [Rangifer tarandus platyrhynchus]|uniref:Uncharacterized protein n=1 Tax=Rangifer tarandus platyrhynchus TaxID=3082113 RepID=A0AC59YMI7_RANTA